MKPPLFPFSLQFLLPHTYVAGETGSWDICLWRRASETMQSGMTHLGCGEERQKKDRQWLKILIILPLYLCLNYQVVIESEKKRKLLSSRYYLFRDFWKLYTQSSNKEEIKVGWKLVHTLSLPRLCLLNNASRFCSRLSFALDFCCVCTIALARQLTAKLSPT